MIAPKRKRSVVMMSIIEALAGVRQWLRREDFERDMDDEIRFHVEMESRELVSRGLSPSEARTRALAAFGGRERFKEEARQDLPLAWVSDLRADLRYALRSLRRTPVFTAVAVTALGIGIGANGALFGIADAAAFRPLPVHEPARLYAVYGHENSGTPLNLSYPTYEDIRGAVPAFSDVAAFTERMVSVASTGAAIGAWAAHVSENYFSLLGVRPHVGRLFRTGDQRLPIAVVSHDFWQHQLGGYDDIVGKVIRVNGAPFAVVGVAPRDFHGTRLLTFAPSLWLPIGMHAQTLPWAGDLLHDRERSQFNILARLSRDTPASAQRQLDALATTLGREHPRSIEGTKLVLLSNRTAINPWLASPDRLSTIGLLSLAGGWLVLLIACADVANLLLARITTRRREIATRLALGATRPRLVRQFLAEGFVLAALGMAAAIPIAAVTLYASRALTPPLDFASSFAPALNVRSMIFMGAVAISSVLFFGILPIVHALTRDIVGMIRGTGHARRPANRLRGGLVAAQVALSVLVLAVAGLFARGLDAAHEIDVGFETDRTAAFTVDPGLLSGYTSADVANLYRRMVNELSAVPGVLAVARATSIPLDGNSLTERVFSRDAAEPTRAIFADYFLVSPEYFATLGLPLIAGRGFTRADTSGTEPVLVNEVLARRVWPDGTERLGQRIRVDSVGGAEVEVVGIVRSNVSRRLGDAPRPLLWRSLDRHPATRTTIIVRGQGGAEQIIPGVRRVMQSIAPDLPLIGLRTMRDRIALAYSAAEGGAVGGTLLGIIASLLAAAGIFGVVSYSVSQRTREMGIRIAIGARPSQLIALIVRSGMRPAVIGLLLGVAAVLSIPAGMSKILYGVSPRDPLVLVGASLSFFIVAIVASLIPAWRGARIDPRKALQAD